MTVFTRWCRRLVCAVPILLGAAPSAFGQSVGMNFEVAGDTLHGQRLALEFTRPLWQDLEGPQLETDWELVMGWQYAFRAWGTP